MAAAAQVQLLTLELLHVPGVRSKKKQTPAFVASLFASDPQKALTCEDQSARRNERGE